MYFVATNRLRVLHFVDRAVFDFISSTVTNFSVSFVVVVVVNVAGCARQSGEAQARKGWGEVGLDAALPCVCLA